MMEGKTYKEIVDYYLNMGLDRKYGSLNKEYLYSIRSDLKKAKLLNEQGLPIKTQTAPPSESVQTPPTAQTKEEEKPPSTQISEENKEGLQTINRRPDWDMLSIEQVNSIGDLKTRAEILNYKTEIEKLKQEIAPEFATRGEIDQLRVDIGTQVGEINETLNKLLSKFEKTDENKKEETEDNGEEEEGEDDEEEGVVEEAITPEVVTVKNPLAGQVETPKTKTGEGLIEVEKGVIVTKLIGLTSKALMWFELDKAGGILPNGEPFPGNLADYVNTCIEDVHAMRGIELQATQRRKIS